MLMYYKCYILTELTFLKVETPQICEKKKWKKNILVLSCAKFIVEFVSVVGFFILSIYLYGKMIFLIAHRFMFSSVRPLATTM